MVSLQRVKPTRQPTSFPTISLEPTVAPTTESPTAKPTSEPTRKSSFKPTKKPTSSPTKKPTYKPTTISPTCKPTVEPSFRPTAEPTFEPTDSPTEEPTIEPTIEPSFQPTIKPTRSPTSKPSKEPTPFPSSKPTIEPSFKPTSEPSVEPSCEPTLLPSFSPTVKPSRLPSSKPVKSPTAKPTVKPTVRKPTISERPSINPSTALVTIKPSSLPSIINVTAHRPSSTPVVVVSSSSSGTGNGTALTTTTLTAVLIAAGAIVFALLVSIIYLRWRRVSNKSTPEAIIARIRAKQAQYSNSPQNRGSAHVRVDEIYRNNDQIQSTTMRGDLRDINQRMDGFSRDVRQDFNGDPYRYDPRNRLPPSENRNLSPRIPPDSFRPPMNINYHQRPIPEGYNGFNAGPPSQPYYGSPRNERDFPVGVRSPPMNSRQEFSPRDGPSPRGNPGPNPTSGPNSGSPGKRAESGPPQGQAPPGSPYTGYDDERFRGLPRPTIPLENFDDHYLRFTRRRSNGIYRGEYDNIRAQNNRPDQRDLDRYDGRR